MSTVLSPLEEGAFVRAAQACDDAAFSRLVQQHRKPVLAQMRAKLQNEEDAEDATQETFVLAYRSLKDLHDVDKFGGWLYAIAARVALKWIHKRAQERERYRPWDEELEHTLSAHEEGEEKRTAFVRPALATLPEECRVVTTLFFLARLEQRAIAHLLNVPLGIVKSRLHRSKKILYNRMQQMTQIQSPPPSADDYGRALIGGMRGVIHWQSLLPGEDLNSWRGGATPGSTIPLAGWNRSGSTLIGEDKNSSASRLFAGDATWADFELSLLVTPLAGGNAQVQFRVDESGQKFYLVDLLLGWQAVALSRVDLTQSNPVQKLSVVNFPLGRRHEYDVCIAARDASLTTYLDGQLVNQVTDFTHSHGAIALNVWEAQTSFRDPRIRLLS